LTSFHGTDDHNSINNNFQIKLDNNNVILNEIMKSTMIENDVDEYWPDHGAKTMTRKNRQQFKCDDKISPACAQAQISTTMTTSFASFARGRRSKIGHHRQQSAAQAADEQRKSAAQAADDQR
jgi:hypothetical protein